MWMVLQRALAGLARRIRFQLDHVRRLPSEVRVIRRRWLETKHHGR
jgi:hypothetical protein